SRASSHGRASVVAMVDGVSESGSDADISDSCQVLLDIERRERKVGDGSSGRDMCNKEEVSEDSPILLGNSGKLVGETVNCDGDTSCPRFV
ncbi:hypothetical protein A2U01_0080373, partial [Trifolium medium]|nr:hypothetical protein [Trifolium medium]